MSTIPVTIRRGRPLAPMQRSLWVSQRRHPTAPLQNMAKLSHFDGEIDIARLQGAFAAVVRASDALGCRIVEEDGTPLVVPADEAPVTELVDVPRAEALSWAQARVAVPIDPSVRPYDSVVLRHEDGTVSWYLALHHLVTDAASSVLVFEATAAEYHGDCVEIGSYRDWVDTVGADDTVRAQRAAEHWRRRSEAVTVARLYQPVRRPTTESSRVAVPVDHARIEQALAGDYRLMTDDLAWTALLMSATAVLINKVARVDAFAIGLPVHNRSGARSVVGTVMEVFPVDVTVAPDDTFRSLHKRLARSIMATMRHAAPGHAPPSDYETVVNVIPAMELGPFGDVPTRHEAIDSGAIDPGHLLRVHLNAYGEGGAALWLDVNHAAADAPSRSRAPQHLARILDAMVAEPDRIVADLDIRTAEERHRQTLWEVGPDPGAGPPDIVSWLAQTVATRDDTAVGDSSQAISGRELWRRAGHVADWLRRQGCEPGARVGLEMGRSVDVVVAILGVLRSGASYVPIDPAHPRARLDRLIERAACAVVLTSLPPIPDGEPESPPGAQGPDHEAYLLFTSGSTGEPKGVPITHRGLVEYIRFAAASYTDPTAPPVAALFSALTFDLTVTSVFTPLVTGGRIAVIEPDGGAGLTAIAERPEITWLKATPSHLEVLVRLVDDEHHLRTLVVGGEAFGSALATRLRTALPGVRVFNEYGPTEAVVGCMIHESSPDELDRWSEVPIGRPAPGVRLAVVDERLRRVPTGAQGELCISHEGMTRGYLDATDGGADDPFVQIDGRRFYRSGDLVRMTDEDTLVYLGRIDDQVKVGGIRLEPTEVAAALEAHPSIGRAAVRLWSPSNEPARRHCLRCGLPSNVPGTRFDDDGVCQMCHAYDRVAPMAESWFKTRDDLAEWAREARRRRTGDYDCLHLLSGGKDSTYALYQLVELGFRPYALTLDNGFISEGAKENVRRSVADLGVDHEFATSDAMNEIFRDSLDRHSNVCHGCYKTIYTLATARAVELGIPLIVTGLSRGQLFETRLIPQQFSADRFDPDAIDRAVIEARKAYHRIDDGPNRLLDTSVFASDDVFDRVTYLDFYRYVDVELTEMLAYLERQAPWVRPSDTGRSTNCLVNAAGIHTHLTEQGYHNYAEPYAWDVRLGHKTRDEAMEELDDQIDPDDVASMLAEIGYAPRRRETLVAWLEPAWAGADLPTPAEVRAFLTDVLPAHAIPAAFVAVDEIPLTTNGKLDTTALPAPVRVHRTGAAIHVSAETDTERAVVAIWERVLGIEPVGIDDDFFAVGGDSLAAMQMIVALSDDLGWAIPEEFAFLHTTPRALAQALDEVAAVGGSLATPPVPREPFTPPPVSVGEQAILFDQEINRDRALYNVGRVHLVHGAVDVDRFTTAIRSVAAHHTPLHWTHGPGRRALTAADAVDVEARSEPIDAGAIDDALVDAHRRPFDLERGPLLRAVIQPVDDGTTAVLLVLHHVSGDASSFDRIWSQIDALYKGGSLPDIELDYAGFTGWQAEQITGADRAHWMSADVEPAASLLVQPPITAEPDGFLKQVATFTPAELRSVGGASGFAASLGCLAAVLRRRAGGDAIGVGVIASTRNHPAADDLVGYLLNTLPLQVRVDTAAPLRDVVSAAARSAGSAMPHRTVPLAEIVAARRRAGLPALATDVLLAYDDLEPAELGSHLVEHRMLYNGSTVADTATLFVEVRPDRVDLSVEFAGAVLCRSDAQALLDDFDAMVRALVRDPACAVGDVTLPSDGTSRLDGGPAGPLAVLVPTILGHVATTPDAVAVRCGGETLTWAELDRRSSSIAATLQRRGVRHGDRVLVCLHRSVDVVASILAAFRIGAAYVPVDPTYPADRIRTTVDASAAVAAVVRGHATELVGRSVEIVDLGETVSGTAVDSWPTGDDEAYVIFTSGSTGRPRGVAVRHRNLAASTMARFDAYERHPGRFLVVSSVAFDSSVAGLFWALTAGGCVLMPTDAEAHDVDALLRLFRDERVTHTLMVPTLYAALLERGAGRDAWPEQIVVAGEACPARLVRRHHDLRPSSALANEYGPTECTVWATAHHCMPGDDPVPIGRPVAGTWVDVVDSAGRPVAAGVRGELVIGGAGLTDGYLDAPEQTSARFATDGSGRSMFRTGDQVVVRNGTVSFLGRTDHQLNVGGMRAEPEEIEGVLLLEDGVAAAVVVAADPRGLDVLIAAADPSELGVAMARSAGADDPATALADALREFSDTDPVLVAHVEVAAGATVTESSLRRRAQASLPSALRPQRYVLHTKLPRSATGKLDRDAAARLAVPAPGVVGEIAAEEPDDETLARVVSTFGGVLGVRMGPDESFFDVGGNSLLALTLVDALRDDLGIEVAIATLYDEPTPRAIASHNGSGGPPASIGEYVVPIQTGGGLPPLFGVHVLGVNAHYYRDLAPRLGPDQPVYGLGIATTLENATAPTEVDRIAARYADELERVAPDGPVALAAVSLGAVVAFELAGILRARGRHVMLLALFDAVGPDVVQTPDHRGRLATHLEQLRADPFRYLRERSINVSLRAMRTAERAEIAVRNAFGKELRDALRVRRFIEANTEAALTRDLPPYDGDVVVFKAELDPFGLGRDDPRLGWGSVALGELAVIPVPGGHVSMLSEPYVDDLAPALAAQLKRAAGRRRAPTPDHVVEAHLRHALASGSFAAAVAAWRDRDDLTPEAVDLIRAADHTLRDLAGVARNAAARVDTVLAKAGIQARVLPTPARMENSTVVLRLDAARPGEVLRVTRLLESALDCRSQSPPPRRWSTAPPESPVTLVMLDDAGTRIRVEWDGGENNAPRRFAPVRALVERAPRLPRRLRRLADSGPPDLGPFLGTPVAMVAPILDVAGVGAEDVLLDIGCGDARVLVEGARRFGCRGRGVERDPVLAAAARARVAAAGLADRIDIVEGDAAAADLSDVTVAFAFLPAHTTAEILERALVDLPSGARFVAHEQVRGDWPVNPDRTRLVMTGGFTVASVWDVP